MSIEDILKQLKTDQKQGLTSEEAASRLKEYGPNALEEKEESAWLKLLSFFWDKGDHVRFDIQGNAYHFLSCTHFKIQFGFDQLTEKIDITVLGMATVLPQVYYNTHGSG